MKCKKSLGGHSHAFGQKREVKDRNDFIEITLNGEIELYNKQITIPNLFW
jgi:hypothetical protein